LIRTFVLRQTFCTAGNSVFLFNIDSWYFSFFFQFLPLIHSEFLQIPLSFSQKLLTTRERYWKFCFSVRTESTQFPIKQTKQKPFDVYPEATGLKIVGATKKLLKRSNCAELLKNIKFQFCFSFVGLMWTRHNITLEILTLILIFNIKR